MADLRGGEVARDSFRYATEIALGDVTFGEGEVLLSRAQSEALLAQWAKEDMEKESGQGPSDETNTGETDITTGGGDEGEGDEGGDVIIPPVEARYRRLHLVISGIPAGKIADVNRGILLPLSNVVDGGLVVTPRNWTHFQPPGGGV